MSNIHLRKRERSIKLASCLAHVSSILRSESAAGCPDHLDDDGYVPGRLSLTDTPDGGNFTIDFALLVVFPIAGLLSG